MKVTVSLNGDVSVEGEDHAAIVQLINTLRQESNTLPNETKPAVNIASENGSAPKPHRWRSVEVGPREAEVLDVLRSLYPEPVRSPDVGRLIEWGDGVIQSEDAASSRASAILCNLKRKKLVDRPKGSSRWELTEKGVNCPIRVIARGPGAHVPTAKKNGGENK